MSKLHRLKVAEPRAAYSWRPPLVADASVLAAALFKEQGRDEARALLHSRSLHAPYLLDFEIANVSMKKLRHDGLSAEAVAEALRAFRRFPIERHAVDMEQMTVLAQRYGLTAYDAAYLCIADELAAPLATLDDKLAGAARVYLGSHRQIHESD
jgi:predicted nucleic acid-binding protein